MKPEMFPAYGWWWCQTTIHGAVITGLGESQEEARRSWEEEYDKAAKRLGIPPRPKEKKP